MKKVLEADHEEMLTDAYDLVSGQLAWSLAKEELPSMADKGSDYWPLVEAWVAESWMGLRKP